MIYLITGVPGSGKSLYAISTLVQQLVGQTITLPNGEPGKRRLVVDGVKGLKLDHVLMAPGVFGIDGQVAPGDGDGVWSWPDWCQPGDVIFIDEVQRWWRPRGNGVKPSRDVAMLETHRHKGVDFVIVTQHPMLLDQNVRRLVGRHTHVRRMFGGLRAALYDWDSCAADPSRIGAATVSYWGYPKKAFDLYVSSELHTKQKQKIPLWLAVPVLAFVGFLAVAPKAYSVMSGAMSGKGISGDKPATVAMAPVNMVPVPAKPASVPQTVVTPVYPMQRTEQVATGCILVRGRCGCLDESGKIAKSEPARCVDVIGTDRPVMNVGPDSPPPYAPPSYSYLF